MVGRARRRSSRAFATRAPARHDREAPRVARVEAAGHARGRSTWRRELPLARRARRAVLERPGRRRVSRQVDRRDDRRAVRAASVRLQRQARQRRSGVPNVRGRWPRASPQAVRPPLWPVDPGDRGVLRGGRVSERVLRRCVSAVGDRACPRGRLGRDAGRRRTRATVAGSADRTRGVVRGGRPRAGAGGRSRRTRRADRRAARGERSARRGPRARRDRSRARAQLARRARSARAATQRARAGRRPARRVGHYLDRELDRDEHLAFAFRPAVRFLPGSKRTIWPALAPVRSLAPLDEVALEALAACGVPFRARRGRARARRSPRGSATCSPRSPAFGVNCPSCACCASSAMPCRAT